MILPTAIIVEKWSMQTVLNSISEIKTETVLAFLPEEGLIRGSEKIIRGPFALQAIFTFGQGDILNLGGKIFGAVADYQNSQNDTYTCILIPYPDKETARETYKQLISKLYHLQDRAVRLVLFSGLKDAPPFRPTYQ